MLATSALIRISLRAVAHLDLTQENDSLVVTETSPTCAAAI
jgi:hypothetical protein